MLYSLLAFPAISVCTRVWVSIIGHGVRHHCIQNTRVLKKWTVCMYKRSKNDIWLDPTNSNSVISNSSLLLTLSYFPLVHPSVIYYCYLSHYFELFFAYFSNEKSHHKTPVFFLEKQMNYTQKLTRLQVHTVCS